MPPFQPQQQQQWNNQGYQQQPNKRNKRDFNGNAAPNPGSPNVLLSHPNNGTQVVSVWQWRRGNSNQNNTKAPYSNTQKNSSTSSIVSPAATSLTMKATNAPLEYKDNTCHTSRGMKPNCTQIVEPA